MDMTTVETIGNVLIAGAVISACTASCNSDSKKVMFSAFAFSVALGISAGLANKHIDPIKLEEEKVIKKELILKQKQAEVEQDKKIQEKIQELRAKSKELDKQIKALGGVTVIEKRTNQHVNFALSAQNARA